MEEKVMLEGCPHCEDGIPAIVTYRILEYDGINVQFIGSWSEELMTACKKYGQMTIVACKKIESNS